MVDTSFFTYLTRGWGDLGTEDVARLQEQIKTLFGDVDELKEDVKKIKDDLSKRLPTWATALIALLTATVGWLAK
jgi:type VI protein secretion system component VasF